MSYINCKMSNEDGSTRNGVVLVPGETINIEGDLKMCRNGLHYYRHPLLASFMSFAHTEYETLWLGEPSGEIEHDGELKSVCSKWTCGEQIEPPVITIEQRTEIAIRCAMTCDNLPESWLKWANAWLDGSDRSIAAAAAAVAAVAAAESAEAAAWAAESAEAAVRAVRAVRAAAWAAADAEQANDLSLLSIIKQVVGSEADHE